MILNIKMKIRRKFIAEDYQIDKFMIYNHFLFELIKIYFL